MKFYNKNLGFQKQLDYKTVVDTQVLDANEKLKNYFGTNLTTSSLLTDDLVYDLSVLNLWNKSDFYTIEKQDDIVILLESDEGVLAEKKYVGHGEYIYLGPTFKKFSF